MVAGRAVLIVPLDGLWGLHDLPWDRTDGDCNGSYWTDDRETADTVASWDIGWVELAEIRDFIAEHFGDLDADVISRSSA